MTVLGVNRNIAKKEEEKTLIGGIDRELALEPIYEGIEHQIYCDDNELKKERRKTSSPVH